MVEVNITNFYRKPVHFRHSQYTGNVPVPCVSRFISFGFRHLPLLVYFLLPTNSTVRTIRLYYSKQFNRNSATTSTLLPKWFEDLAIQDDLSHDSMVRLVTKQDSERHLSQPSKQAILCELESIVSVFGCVKTSFILLKSVPIVATYPQFMQSLILHKRFQASLCRVNCSTVLSAETHLPINICVRCTHSFRELTKTISGCETNLRRIFRLISYLVQVVQYFGSPFLLAAHHFTKKFVKLEADSPYSVPISCSTRFFKMRSKNSLELRTL